MNIDTIVALLALGLVLESLILPPLCIWMGWRLSRGQNPAPPVAATMRSAAKVLGTSRVADDVAPEVLDPAGRMNA